MHRCQFLRLPTAAGLLAGPSILPRLLVGLGLWIGFPTSVAYQDMMSLVSGLESGADEHKRQERQSDEDRCSVGPVDNGESVGERRRKLGDPGISYRRLSGRAGA